MGLHDGHRQRMRQQFISHGPQSMADHELLELALFYAIPRRDTNETALRLLEQFGSLDRVLTAPEQELEQVEGDAASNTTFKLVVTNGRNNALEVTKANFAVKAEGYLAYQNDKLQVIYPDSLSHQVKQGETFTYYVKATGLNALTDGPVTLTYYPDLQYSEFSANWELAADVLEPDLSDPATT